MKSTLLENLRMSLDIFLEGLHKQNDQLKLLKSKLVSS
jgi:hypothetical protein